MKAGELRPEPIGVVVLLDVDNLLGGGNGFDGDIAIAAVMKNDEAAMFAPKEQLEGNVAIRHRDDGVHDIRMPAASEIA